MTGGFSIRPLARSDVEVVHAIDTLVFETPWSRELLAQQIDRGDRCHLVAVRGDAVLGHGATFHVAGEATLSTIAVDPGQQGSAVATSILLALFHDAINRGTTDVTLEVRASNRRAQRLYHRFGFAPEGIRTGYYASTTGAPAEDAVLMWARNIHSDDGQARRVAIAESLSAAATTGAHS